MLFSDKEDIASQAPSMGQLYAAVQQLATTVVHLQNKVTRLEQLAYIRKPKCDVRLALMSKQVPPKVLFSAWITNRIVVRITRSILIDHIFKTSNLIDTMCKLIMKEVTNASGLSPIYADESKSGLFLTYDDGANPEGSGSGSGSGGGEFYSEGRWIGPRSSPGLEPSYGPSCARNNANANMKVVRVELRD
jgi:hypothetical protein